MNTFHPLYVPFYWCPFVFVWSFVPWCVLSCSGFMHLAWPECQHRPCPLSFSLFFMYVLALSSAVSLPPIWMIWTCMNSLRPLCLPLPQLRCFSHTFAFLLTIVFSASICDVSVRLLHLFISWCHELQDLIDVFMVELRDPCHNM